MKKVFTKIEADNEELKKYLLLDNTKCNVLPMSELCVTQFTRKRVGNDVLSYLVKPCEHCKGNGHVHEDMFVISRMRADLLDLFADGRETAIVDLNHRILDKIFDNGLFTPEIKQRWKDKKIYFVPHKTFREDFYFVRGELPSPLPEKARMLK